jgi:hypothetical protein
MAEEIDKLRAELAACRMQVTALEQIRALDAEWIGRAQSQIATLIAAVQDLRAGRPIDPEAVELLATARPASKWT